MTVVSGKRALVTGGSRGIGALVAERLAAKGAHVVLWARGEDRLREEAAKIAAAGGSVETASVDVGDRHAVRAAADELLARGRVDVLVNNAGTVSGRPVLELTDEQIERTFAVNVLSHFWTVRAFLPQMMAVDRGHIVTVASTAGIWALPSLSDYSASKFAAFGFDEALRTELARMGSSVRTTIVCPALIDTGMFAGFEVKQPLLLPTLDPDRVAYRIVRAIERDERRVVMPWTAHATWIARLLPVGAFEAFGRFLGLDSCMDGFVGHAHAEERPSEASPSPTEPASPAARADEADRRRRAG